MSEGETFTLDVPHASSEIDEDGVEWFRMSPDWVFGNGAPRAWALALKNHRKLTARAAPTDQDR